MNPDATLQASEEFEVDGEEAVPARGLPSPTQPTRNEIHEHVMTHLLHSSWCGHCLRARGTSLPHFRSKTEGERVVPTVSIDYFFTGPSGQQEAQGVLPMLAVKSHESTNDVRTCCGAERTCGFHGTTTCCRSRLVFKSVQEPAILALKQAVRESMLAVEFVMEESPVEERRSNGTIEVMVREIQKQVRVMKSALEERMKCEVPSRHPVLAFLVEQAGRLMSRYQVGRDGRTAFELHASEPYRRQLVEFGERVYFMPIRPWRCKTSKTGSQMARWSTHRHQRSQ